MSVSPIAAPIRPRRNRASGRAWRSGEAGCSSSVPNRHAESMKPPSRAASIRYSGQWRRSVSVIVVSYECLWPEGICAWRSALCPSARRDLTVDLDRAVGGELLEQLFVILQAADGVREQPPEPARILRFGLGHVADARLEV